ncbi:MAG: type II toxin-antitoxin system VapC family toxin [Anaerolineae bacterium]|nr:type II toxin-antitoxin system VapC family toxin [Anaerolineae bacterium]
MTVAYVDAAETRFYLDTMIPYALLRGTNVTAQTLFRSIEAGALTAYTSILTFDELVYRLVLALIRDNLPGSPLDHLRQDERTRLARFGPAVSTQLRRLASFPNLHLVPVWVEDVGAMMDAMDQYQLRPRDSLHLAAMQRVGCFSLLSHDAHFDAVRHIRRYTL